MLSPFQGATQVAATLENWLRKPAAKAGYLLEVPWISSICERKSARCLIVHNVFVLPVAVLAIGCLLFSRHAGTSIKTAVLKASGQTLQGNQPSGSPPWDPNVIIPSWRTYAPHCNLLTRM